MKVLDTIGGTRMLPLQHMVPRSGARILLRQHDKAARVVAVEPEESAARWGRPSGSHKIEGVGAGFVVPLWDETLADEIQTVSSAEAMARRLARE